MSKRVVFLDIDGVLNSVAWIRSRNGQGSRLRDLDHAAVARVQEICERTGAEVVISSSWRCLLRLPVLRNLLREHGLEAKVIGKTPVIDSRTSHLRCRPETEAVQRGEEIQAWLAGRQDVTSIVILDDDGDMAHLRDRLVQTSYETGLLAEHVELAVALLAGSP